MPAEAAGPDAAPGADAAAPPLPADPPPASPEPLAVPASVAGARPAPLPPGPRTVLYLHSSAGRYGADRQLLLMAAGLDPARYRPLVLLAEDGPLVGDLHDAGVETIVRPLAVLRREVMSAAGLGRVTGAWAADAGGVGRLARARKVGLVHTNTSVTLGGAAAARVAGVPHVWHVREIYAGFERWFSAYRRLLSTADLLPCVSEAVLAQMADLRPGPGGRPRGVVLPDGLAVDPVRAPRAAAREALGLPQDAFVVAVLGRISTWKGQEVLVEALARPPLREPGRSAPRTVGLLAGAAWRDDPAPVATLRRLAAAGGVADRLVLPGFVDDTSALFGAADVVAVPSTRPDPLPNAALEAAAAGCCVVAADHGGLGEIVDDGRTGLLVRPGDAAALAAALARVRDEPGLGDALGAAAAEDVRARFAPEALPRRLQELYDGLR